MTPSEIISEIQKLPLIKRKEVLYSLSKNLNETDTEDLKLQEALLTDGLIREIKPLHRRKIGDFKPVKIKGKPLSETIIEERR